MICRYIGNDETHYNKLEAMEHIRGANIKFNDDKCILRLNIGNLCALGEARLVQRKQTP